MHEKIKALQFYRLLLEALNTTGINKIEVSLSEDGELEANVILKEDNGRT